MQLEVKLGWETEWVYGGCYNRRIDEIKNTVELPNRNSSNLIKLEELLIKKMDLIYSSSLLWSGQRLTLEGNVFQVFSYYYMQYLSEIRLI